MALGNLSIIITIIIILSDSIHNEHINSSRSRHRSGSRSPTNTSHSNLSTLHAGVADS